MGKSSIFSLLVTILSLFSWGVLNIAATEEYFPNDKTSKADFKEFMKGLMKGAFEQDFPETEKCFKGGVVIIQTLEVAIDDIKQETKEGIEEGIRLIGDIVKNSIFKEEEECKEAMQEFDKLIDMAETLSHPLSFLYHAGHNIVVNHVEIEQEVGAAVDAWDKEDFFTFGFYVGEVLDKVFIETQKIEGNEMSNEKNSYNIELQFRAVDFKNLMEGIMKGVFKKEFPETEECFKGGVEIIQKLKVAFDDIKRGTKESVEEGVRLIGDIVQKAAAKELVECEGGIKEFDELINMAEILSHPLSFLYHTGHNIVVNHVEIEQEVHDAIEAWREEEFYNVGFNIGEALEQVFIGTSSEEKKIILNKGDFFPLSGRRSAFKEFMKGLMRGAFHKDFPNTKRCFKDGVEIIQNLEVAIDDIKEGTKESVAEGIKIIGDIVKKSAEKEMVECEEASKEFHDIIDMAETLSHPMSFLYHAGHNIVVNHVEIEEEIAAVIEAWDEVPKDYYTAGYFVGEVLEQVFAKKEKTWIEALA